MQLLIDENIILPETFSRFGLTHFVPANFQQLPASTLKNIEAIIIRSKTQVDKSLLKKLPKLKFIGSTVAGTNHLDLPLIQQFGVQLATANGCNANSVAEYVICCILWHYQNKLSDLTTKTLGVIGFGHVGKALAIKVRLLGLKIKVFDPPIFQQKHITLPKNITALHHIEEILSCDILSLHSSLDSDPMFPSRNLINADLLKQLTSKQLLINAGRGELIDETALAEQRLNQEAPTIIIDCWQNEPNINSQLLAHVAIATPHIAGHSLVAKQNGTFIIAQALNKFLNSNIDINHFVAPVNKPIINLDTSAKEPLQQFYKIIKQIYHPQQDDLKQQLKSKFSNISDFFEYYRKYYPARYEWHEYDLNALVEPSNPLWEILHDSSIERIGKYSDC